MTISFFRLKELLQSRKYVLPLLLIIFFQARTRKLKTVSQRNFQSHGVQRSPVVLNNPFLIDSADERELIAGDSETGEKYFT
jgi:hypothetical protein